MTRLPLDYAIFLAKGKSLRVGLVRTRNLFKGA